MPVLFEETTPTLQKTSKKEKHVVHSFTTPLTAYLMHPQDIRFETQEEDENVILFLRQHIIVLVPKIALALLIFFVPILFFPVLIQYLPSLIEIPGGYIVAGTLFWYLGTFGYLLTIFLHWFFNIYIVTNKRIIDIDFLYLLYKKFAEAQIIRIQDLSFRTGGIAATMFNYGDVMIQTAGELPNFTFEKVPRPSEVVHIISDLLEEEKGKGVYDSG